MKTPDVVRHWFRLQGWKPFAFQEQAWQAYLDGKSGLIHASTGYGKTFGAWMGPLIEWFSTSAEQRQNSRNPAVPLRVLWITPLKALAVDTGEALSRPVKDLGIPWTIETRTGDTSSARKERQKNRLPSCLITTPESLSLLLSYPGGQNRFKGLQAVIVDEWHELVGSKRGVLMELALARLLAWRPDLRIWGLSATLGNTRTALTCLLGNRAEAGVEIRGITPKTIRIDPVIPETPDRFPWAGHLGLKMLPQVLDLIKTARSVLVFTNTRSQSELWFQAILNARPQWKQRIALHHGSVDRKRRLEVERLLRNGDLQCVVCTSSLDLGVDFSPVDRVIQIGSPKGVARLMQRAGRSGHRPGKTSRVFCVPTNTLQLLEIAAARRAVQRGDIESRTPVINPLDVLAQHMLTLATGDGFSPESLYDEVHTTHAYAGLSRDEFHWVLAFAQSGGSALDAYPEYRRMTFEAGRYVVRDDIMARRHRMCIGVITAEAAVRVRYLKGATLGMVEESFASRLKPGDRFIFAGNLLETVRIRDMTLYVKKAGGSRGTVPQWMGGTMPLSTRLADSVRKVLENIRSGNFHDPEMAALAPVMAIQTSWSVIPGKDELLIESVKTRQGWHVFIYPFEGHLVHEGLGALFACRIARILPITLSVAVNDYGLELFSDREIPVREAAPADLFSLDNLERDLAESLNFSEMARRQFREIARISGLVFPGYPGHQKTGYQLQASSGLIFNVFVRYDPENLLVVQAKREVMDAQLQMVRIAESLARINGCRIRIEKTPWPTPLAFPLMVNRLRSRISSENLADRIESLRLRLETAASRSILETASGTVRKSRKGKPCEA